jgi:hypothetical protein
MQIAAEKIAPGRAITTIMRVEVYGTPGPGLEQVRQAAGTGIRVSVKPTAIEGFARG